MPVLVSFTLPTESFAFDAAATRDPELRVTLDQVVPVDDTPLPFFWVESTDDGFEAAAERDPAIAAIDCLESVDGRRLYRAEWTDDQCLLATIIESRAALLDATLEGGVWRFGLRFDGPGATAPFQRQCHERGIPIDVTRVVSVAEDASSNEGDDFGLTAVQRETLVTAQDAGYFKRPRGATLSDLSDRLGVSEQAVSRRIGRGLDALVETTLVRG
ncbi:bacterio-opsin activator domain-containing protein [Halobaculum marinum]|uniref:Bacterio-opsin activator domain-containing protein n=1 Tax=Halobaculum marinum TaxID=3031996 RepID=A0ABD5WX41_9EURY